MCRVMVSARVYMCSYLFYYVPFVCVSTVGAHTVTYLLFMFGIIEVPGITCTCLAHVLIHVYLHGLFQLLQCASGMDMEFVLIDLVKYETGLGCLYEQYLFGGKYVFLLLMYCHGG